MAVSLHETDRRGNQSHSIPQQEDQPYLRQRCRVRMHSPTNVPNRRCQRNDHQGDTKTDVEN